MEDEGPIHVAARVPWNRSCVESSITPCSSGTEAVAVEGRTMSAGNVWSKALFDTSYFEGSKI